jgi:hypothetical protein
MTRYLTGVKLTSDPFLEIYEGTGPSSVPELLGIEPPVAAAPSRVKFSEDQTLMVTVVNARRDEIAGLGDPGTPLGGIRVFSPDGLFLLMGGTASIAPKLLRKAGQYYVPQTGITFPAGFVAAASISDDADVIAFKMSGATDLRVFSKTGTGASATWAGVSIATMPGSPQMTHDAEYIFMIGQSGVKAIQHLSGSSYADAGVADATTLQAWTLDTPGNYRVAYSVGSGAVNQYKLTAGALSGLVTIATTGSVRVNVIRYLQKGRLIAILSQRVGADPGQEFRIRDWDGTAFTQIFASDLSLGVASSGSDQLGDIVSWNDGQYVAVYYGRLLSSTSKITRLLKTSNTAAPFTYTLANTYTLSDATVDRPYAFSPDGTLLHMRASTNDWHYQTVSPWAADQVLPWRPDLTGVAARDVRAISYDVNGGIITADTTSGLYAALKDANGTYLNFATLEGTFITVWDREGDTFFERSFVQHPLNSVVSDIVISKANYSMLYHVAASGRYVYDIHGENFLLKATKFVANDLASLAAISPHETHFVVVYRNSVLATVIRLYEFDGSFAVTEHDNKPVDYGPPSFSACATILVAHGGVQPYSLFNHDEPTETLIPEVVSVTNWEEESEILVAKFSADCSGVLIVTPDKVISIRDEAVVDEDTIPTTPDEPEIIDNPDDGDGGQTIITPPPGGGDGSGGGNGGPWNVGPDGTLDNLSYIPYVSISVTFRTWP